MVAPGAQHSANRAVAEWPSVASQTRPPIENTCDTSTGTHKQHMRGQHTMSHRHVPTLILLVTNKTIPALILLFTKQKPGS